MGKTKKDDAAQKKRRPPVITVYSSDEVKKKLAAYAGRVGLTDTAAASVILARALGVLPPGEGDSSSPQQRPATPRGAAGTERKAR